VDVQSAVKALHAARDDPKVRAIVLRINSPGGDAIASDSIWKACLHAKKRLDGSTLPMVASFGSVAASGGYYIAAAADRIVAQPSSVTGSIGVVSVQFNGAELLDKLGVSTQALWRGRHAEFLAGGAALRGMTKEESEIISRLVGNFYQEFLYKVSLGRHHVRDKDGKPLPWAEGALAEALPDLMEGVAEGRVWTGNEAQRCGLVDTVGGLQDAVMLAKELGGMDSEDLEVRVYPPEPTVAEQLQELVGGKKGRDRAGTGPWVAASGGSSGFFDLDVASLLLLGAGSHSCGGDGAALLALAARLGADGTARSELLQGGPTIMAVGPALTIR